MVNRRLFLGSLLSTLAAPAIVRADSLMRITPLTSSLDEFRITSAARYDFLNNDFTFEAFIKLDGWDHLALVRKLKGYQGYANGKPVILSDPRMDMLIKHTLINKAF